ncbi:MAG: class I SAM-dependent methyltransferase, partial [Proteobacteria bacterium]|nr:class I SAM-dependent methyltransferase [Pseudomonadota bacterium]
MSVIIAVSFSLRRDPYEVTEISSQITIAVVCFSKLRLPQAKEFCALHELPLLKEKDNKYDLQLLFHDDLIALFDSELNTSISIDFTKGALAHRQQFGGGRGQAIAKAIGLKSGITPTVLDTTAGLAGDAFVLATLGCPITMVERSPVLFRLIEDAINRAELSESFQHIMRQGFHIINADANHFIAEQMQNDDTRPDVIYIDPMYPERKKSALVKKDMQILQKLHGEADNTAELLENALRYARKRVVVKRPSHAETLSERTPNTSIKSKKTRY